MIKKRIGIISIIILTLIPIIIWIFMQPLSTRFSGSVVTFRSLGQIFSLSGVVLFSLSFILNSRLKLLEDYFGGLDRMFVVHHVVGASSFVLLLFHPLFLAATQLQFSIMRAAQFLLPSSNWPTNFGIIALLIMELLLVITFFVKLKYNIWKFSHKFLGLAFAFAVLHVLTISSDISNSVLLRYYILFICFLGLAFFAYRTLFGKIAVKKTEYVVKKYRKINSHVDELTLSPKNSKIIHTPGQFVFISFKDEGISPESHPFTISSSPNEDNLRFTIKKLGDFTSQLKKIRMGSLVNVEGPFGRFYNPEYNKKEQIWIAGGIGITPFLSAARSLQDNSSSKLIELYYSVKTKDEAVFLDELMQISAKNKNFKVFPFITSEQGLITAKKIVQIDEELSGKEILMCGPPAMMQSLRTQFISRGVKNNRIHSEEFALL